MRYYSILLFFLMHPTLFSFDSQPIIIRTASFEHDIQLLRTYEHQTIFLQTITYDADIYVDLDEFRYLTGLSHGRVVKVSDIIRATTYLHAKHCFESITLEFFLDQRVSDSTITSTVPGFHLHITLAGMWRFSGLTIQGMFIGKDLYRQYYSIKKGDPFDIGKHQACVEQIEEFCKAQGYCDVRIKSTFSKDPVTKMVHTTLKIERGKQYRIAQVRLSIDVQQELRNLSHTLLHKELQKKFLKPLSGTVYTKPRLTAVAKSMKRWCAEQGFLHVGIELHEHAHPHEQSVDLQVTVELGSKKKFYFIGNNFFTSAQLIDQLLAFGTSLSVLPVELLAEEILQWYRKKGFWSATVQAREDHDQCTFTIDEQQRVIIDAVQLYGITQCDQKHLLKQFFGKIVRHAEFDQDSIAQAIDQLIAFYLDEGFWQCTILKQLYEPIAEKPNHYILQVSVDEGVRSFITSTTVQPFSEMATEEPFCFPPHEPVPFTVHELQRQRTVLEKRVRERGYGHAPVRVQVAREAENVSLQWHVDTNALIPLCGKTIVQGTTTVPFAYIMRELAYKEHQPFDGKLLDISRSRLQELRLFDHVHFYPTTLEGIEGEQPIFLHLHADDKFEIRVRAGLGLQQLARHNKFAGLTYKAGGSFFVKNPFHRADFIRFDADITRSYQRWQGWYVQPWFFQFPVQTCLHAYAHRYQQPGLQSGRKSLYEFWQRGLLLEFHRTWQGYESGLNVGFECMKTTVLSRKVRADMFHKQIARAMSFEPELLDRNVPYVLFEPTLFIDRLDNSIDPHYGSLTVLSCKTMIPIAVLGVQSYFIKLLAEQSLFFPIQRLVCAFHMRIGHIFHQTFENIMPAERFYLGGSHSIRSYEPDMCPPLGCIRNDEGIVHLVPQGARSLLHASAEIRMPMYDRICGAIFQDIGLLSNNMFTDITRERILAGTGFGLRITTPLGPLRFDIAWKWYKSVPQESSYAWFLTFGHAF